MGVLNLIGIKSTTFFGSILLLIQIIIVLAAIGIWISYITNDMKHLNNLFSLKPFHFDSVKGVIEASSLAIFSFLGFDAVTTLAEESINPRRDIPRAMMICTFIGFTIMFLTGYLGVLAIPDWQILTLDQSWVNATLFHVAKLTGGVSFALIYTAGFILAMVVTNLVGTTAATRLLFGMGRDSVISKRVFSAVNQRWKTPHGSILFIVCIELILGSYANQDQLAELINYGAIAGFILLNLNVIYLGYKLTTKKLIFKTVTTPEIKSPKFWVRFLLFPTIALTIMLAIFINMKLTTMLFGTIWGCFGILYYLFIKHSLVYKNN